MRYLCVLMLLLTAAAFAELPTFSSPFFVQANGVDLVVTSSIPDPCVVDWDGDGVKDLVIGHFSGGNVRFYPNSGTNASPVFTNYTLIYAGGSPVAVSYGWCTGATNPQVVDYNGDGYLDLLIGERNGGAWLYDGSSGGLQAGVRLEAGGVPINTGYNSSPRLVDWDEDGYWDLLLGGYPTSGGSTSGFLHLYMNDDSNPDELNFTTYTNLPFFNLWRTTHEFFDLDRDGDKDLILGNENGLVYFAPNTGTNSAPVFTGYSPLECEGVIIDVGARARETVDDWNEDGVPDLIVCNTTNDKVQVFLGYDLGIEESETGLEGSGPFMSVAGSPTQGLFSVNLQLTETGPVDFTVYDIQGRAVSAFTRDLPAGSSTVSFDIGGRPAGIYFLSVESGGTVLNGRVALTR